MLAVKPPMGWNCWNTFGPEVNAKVVCDTADKFIELGLKDCGYEYLVIDDCWSLKERDENGRIVPDPEKFPDGIKGVADYVHSKGLKLGIYSCVGTRTCAGYPASFGHEFVDAQTFADWGIDFLKYDYCYKPGLANGPMLYNAMSMALKATGREILFSASNWGEDETENWIRSVGAHMYRSTGDIHDNYPLMARLAKSQMNKLMYSAPGCYNDIDMLICGMHGKGNAADSPIMKAGDGLTDTEYKLHFALWCLYQSPLMIGVDLSTIDDVTLALLKNRELLRINQDAEARPPIVLGNEERPIFFKHLENGEYALAMVNFADDKARSHINLFDIGLHPGTGYGLELYDIFTGEKMGVITEFFAAEVPAHDCRIYRGRMVKVK